MKPPYVPFVSSLHDAALLDPMFSGAALVRTSSEALLKGRGASLPGNARRWLDTGFDVFGQSKTSIDKAEHARLQKIPGAIELLTPEGRVAEGKSGRLREVALAFLNTAGDSTPAFLTVPQFPVLADRATLKLNVALARAASEWDATSGFGGHWILPVILTHFSQYSHKTDRDRLVNNAKRCADEAEADGVWLVDSDLADQSGAARIQTERLPALIKLHAELQDALPDVHRIVAGPYWSTQLNLWCKGLATDVAVGLGSAYQYHLSGGVRRPSKDRVAIAPLRRWAVVSPGLHAWLSMTIEGLAMGDPNRADLISVQKLLSAPVSLALRRQVAKFHSTWVAELADAPAAGRSLLLFQQLTAAYAFGKALEPLPESEGSARRPERVAEQQMTNCL